MYQPYVADISEMREYCEELAVAASLIQGLILGTELVPSLQSAFSRVLRISTATLVVILDQLAMAVSSRGRGRGCGGRSIRGGRHCCEHCGKFGI